MDMDINWFLSGIWGVMLISVLVIACCTSLKSNILQARYIILTYTLLIFICILGYVYFFPGQLNYPDNAFYRDYVYLIPFLILPIIVSIGLWHVANRILLPSMRLKSTLIFLICWFISPIILFAYLKSSPDPESMMGMILIFVFATPFSLLAFIVNMLWLVRVSRKGSRLG